MASKSLAKRFPFTQKYLHGRLSYDRDTGQFTWKRCSSMPSQWNAKWGGTIAGCPDSKGYIVIQIDGKRYKAHRLAWFYVHGEQPAEIDHKDRITNHNWLSNLRPSNHNQNKQNAIAYSNNSSGYKGVSWHTKTNKWHARIQVNGNPISLGYFKTAEKAGDAYSKAAKKYHKKFARWGKTVAETGQNIAI